MESISVNIVIPQIIKDYAQVWYEWHDRQNYKSIPHRDKFENMTDDEVAEEFNNIQRQILVRFGIPWGEDNDFGDR